MQISTVNYLNRQLEKFKSSVPSLNNKYHEHLLTEEDRPLLENLNAKINELEDLLMEFKLNHNSSAAKILKWSRYTLPQRAPELAKAVRITANESEINLLFHAESTFDLNLKTEYSSTGRWVSVNPQDREFYDNYVLNKIDLKTLINFSNYDGVFKNTDHSFYPNVFQFNLKYSKKLVKNEAIMEDILLEILIPLWNHLMHLKSLK